MDQKQAPAPAKQHLPLRIAARLIAALAVFAALWYGAPRVRDAIFAARHTGSFKAADALAPIAFLAGVLVLWALARAAIALASAGFRLPRDLTPEQVVKLGLDKRDAFVMGGVALVFAVMGAVALYLYETRVAWYSDEKTWRFCLVLAGVSFCAALVTGLFALIRAVPPFWYWLIRHLCFTRRKVIAHALLAVALTGVVHGLLVLRAQSVARWHLGTGRSDRIVLAWSDPRVEFYLWEQGSLLYACSYPKMLSQCVAGKTGSDCLRAYLERLLPAACADDLARAAQHGWTTDFIRALDQSYKVERERLAAMSLGTLKELDAVVQSFQGSISLTALGGSGSPLYISIAGVPQFNLNQSRVGTLTCRFEARDNRLWLLETYYNAPVVVFDPQHHFRALFYYGETSVLSPSRLWHTVPFWLALIAGAWLVVLAPFFYLRRAAVAPATNTNSSS